MTSLYISVYVWAIVAFMLTDEHCKNNEKRALVFLFLIAVTLTGIGVWNFEFGQVLDISLRSLVSICLLLVVMVQLKIKSKLIKLQSEATGKSCNLIDFNLKEIPDTPLISIYKKVNVVTWLIFLAEVVLQAWEHHAVPI